MNRELIADIVFEGIDWTDYPDFCDIYISSATYNTKPMTGLELDEAMEDTTWMYYQFWQQLF